MQEPLAAAEEAGKERDDPGTETDDGVGNGNALDSRKGRIIRDQAIGITPLVAVDWAGVAEDAER